MSGTDSRKLWNIKALSRVGAAIVGLAALAGTGLAIGETLGDQPVTGTGVSAAAAAAAQAPVVRYKTEKINGLDVFYREAGPADGPVIVLLHGFPTSSHMFRNLIPALADRYRVIAPDYPGFGQSSAPSVQEYEYTFDNLAGVVDTLLERVGARRYTLYVQDYGAPVGYRIAAAHPERVTGLIVQNGNAYDEGLDNPFWEPIKRLWADPSEANKKPLRDFLTTEGTRWQYTHGVRDVTRISPDTWTIDQALMDRPGNKDVQLQLFFSYGSNAPLYPSWQAYFRAHQPPTLIVWGKNDQIFPAAGAEPYKRDLKNLDFNLLDTGHFALEEDGGEIGRKIRAFMAERVVPGLGR